MHFFFADDSTQKSARKGMGQTLAFGGILVPSENLQSLSNQIDSIALDAGIPGREEIKWSPSKDTWIYSNLIGDARFACYSKILHATTKADAVAIVTVCDPEMRKLKKEWGFERCVLYTLERVSTYTESLNSQAIVISDRPSGGKKEEKKFLVDYLSQIESNHNYMIEGNFALNLLTAPSHHIRLLQVADLITSITTAMTAGQIDYAKDYIEIIKPMFARNSLGSIGGTGLKVYPDQLINLYYWVLREESFVKTSKMSAIQLPHAAYKFAETDGLSNVSG